MIKAKPFLKWAGNKYRCIETIINALPPAKRLIEPFTGSGAVFLNSRYSQYLLAERNADLVMLFSFLQQEGLLFVDYCANFFTIENNSEARYYQFREQFNRSDDPRYKAALFLYLNRHGYNGLCRYNQRGIYNVPFGRYIKPYFPRKEMTYFYEKCKTATFICADFRSSFTQAKKGDLIYCDPPYVPLSSSANFTSYTHQQFKEDDQINLAELAMATAARGVPVVISNHDTEFTRHHYRHGKIISFLASRSISCKANYRQPIRELVVIFGH